MVVAKIKTTNFMKLKKFGEYVLVFRVVCGFNKTVEWQNKPQRSIL